MGLLGNGIRTNFGVQKSWCTTNAKIGDVYTFTSHQYRGIQEGQTTVKTQRAIPVGSYPSGTFYPPQEAGQMSFRPVGEGVLTGSLQSDIQMLINLTGSSNFNADLGSVISMLCAMTGSGTLSADILGIINGTVNFTGSGDLAADIKGIANAAIDLTGEGNLEAIIAAYGNMSIDIVVTGTGLSTANVGQAVWTAILNQFDDDPESAAAKLLAAGSAGDPWSTSLPASYTGAQAGKLLDQIQTLVDELHKIQGLDADNPMTVTPDNRTAGTINLDITGDGETSTTVTRND